MSYRTGAMNDGTIVAQDIRDHRRRGRLPAAQFAGPVRRGGQLDRPVPLLGRAGGERGGVHQHRADERDARVRRDAGRVRLRVPDGPDRRAPGARSCGGPRTQLRRARRPSGDRRGDRTQPGVLECMHRALEELGDPSAPSNGGKVGQGFACSMQPYGRSVFFADRASCWIGLEQDGTMIVRAGVTDLGAGQAASLVDIAGEILGVTADRSSVHIGDTALTPLTGGTFATRQLYMSGNATLKVARELRDKLAPVAADLLGLRARPTRVRRQQGGGGRRARSRDFDGGAVPDCRESQRDALLPQHLPRRDGRVRSLDWSRAARTPTTPTAAMRSRSRSPRTPGRSRSSSTSPATTSAERSTCNARWDRSRVRWPRASVMRSARTSRSTTG